jgi:hypothetical protein
MLLKSINMTLFSIKDLSTFQKMDEETHYEANKISESDPNSYDRIQELFTNFLENVKKQLGSSFERIGDSISGIEDVKSSIHHFSSLMEREIAEETTRREESIECLNSLRYLDKRKFSM